MQKNPTLTAQVMQGAFDLYYEGFQAARKITDVLAKRDYSKAAQDAIYSMRWRMEADLKSACDSRWHRSDMYWCFQHIYNNNGSYRDDSWDGWKQLVNIPMGVSHFIQNVEERGGKFADSASAVSRAQQEAKRLADAGKWEKCGEQLESVKSAIENVGPYLWVCIPGNAGKSNRYIDLIADCANYAGKLHGAADKGMKIEQGVHAAKNDPNFKRDLAIKALASLVGTLPVFGKLYAEVIEGAPAAIQYFHQLAAQRNAAIFMQ